MGCWRTELSSCCFPGFWKLWFSTALPGCLLDSGLVPGRSVKAFPPPHTIVSRMWCFNLSELRWHISDKWFLGAAIHPGSNSMAPLYPSDWFLGFRLSGYTSEGSCQLPKCMKLYYAAHFENVCTTFFYLQIKKAVKLGKRKQRGYKDQIPPLTVKSCISPQCKKRVPFSFSLCAAEVETDCHNSRRVWGWSVSQTKRKHQGLLEAVRFEKKKIALFLLERKLIFPDLMIETWPNVFPISHLLICKLSCCACPERRQHKGNPR